jgi:hypothetical protein
MGSGQDAADRVGVTVPYGELRVVFCARWSSLTVKAIN